MSSLGCYLASRHNQVFNVRPCGAVLMYLALLPASMAQPIAHNASINKEASTSTSSSREGSSTSDPTTTPILSQSASNKSNTTDKSSFIAAMTLGVILFLVLVGIAVFFYLQRRRTIMARRRRKYQVGSPFNFQESAYGYPGAEAFFKSQMPMLTPHQRNMIMSSPFMANNMMGVQNPFAQGSPEITGYPQHYDPKKMLLRGPNNALFARPDVPYPTYPDPSHARTTGDVQTRPRPMTSPPTESEAFQMPKYNQGLPGRASAHNAIELPTGSPVPMPLAHFTPPLLSPQSICQYHSADDVQAPPPPPPKSPMYMVPKVNTPPPPPKRLSYAGIAAPGTSELVSEGESSMVQDEVITLSRVSVPEVVVTSIRNSFHIPQSTVRDYDPIEPSNRHSGSTAFDISVDPQDPDLNVFVPPLASPSQEPSVNDVDPIAVARATFGAPKKKRKPLKLANLAEIVIPPGQSPPLSPVVFRLETSPTNGGVPLDSPDTIPSPASARSQSSVRSWFKFGKNKEKKAKRVSFQCPTTAPPMLDSSPIEKLREDNPCHNISSDNFPYYDERYYREVAIPQPTTPHCLPSETSRKWPMPKKKTTREKVVSMPAAVHQKKIGAHDPHLSTVYYDEAGKVSVRAPTPKGEFNEHYVF